MPVSGIGYGWRLLFDISHLGFDGGEGRRAPAPFPDVHARTHRFDVLFGSVRFLLAGHAVGGENEVMPRTLRASAGGYCYHALNRGNERSRVFHDADDCHAFVASLRAGCARVPMRLIGFCAMPNHFHLVLWPYEDGDLSVWMQWLLTNHVHSYRKRYRGSGHLWQGRFRSFPIEEDQHLLSVLRYVERNPLRASLVTRAQDWAWSSLPLCSIRRCCRGLTQVQCRDRMPGLTMSSQPKPRPS